MNIYKSKWMPIMYVVFIGCVSLLNMVMQAKIIEKDYMISYRQELIDGKTFKHRIDVDGLRKKETFAINDQQVTADIFEEALLEAEKQELKQQRQHENELRIQKMRARQKIRIKIALEELRDKLVLLQKEVKPLLDDRLDTFIKFSAETLADIEDFRDIISNFIPNVKKVITRPLQEQELADLEQLKEQVITRIKAVKQLVADTIEHVIEKADDTQLLKELLELVS